MRLHSATVGNGSVDASDMWQRGRRWNDRTKQWISGNPQWSAERIAAARTFIRDNISNTAGNSARNIGVELYPAPPFARPTLPGTTALSDFRQIGIDGAAWVRNNVLPSNVGSEITLNVRIPRGDGSFEEFEVIADFLEFVANSDGTVSLTYHEVKSSVRGIPGFEGLTQNQAIFLEAYARGTPGLTVSPTGPKWNAFVQLADRDGEIGLATATLDAVTLHSVSF